MDIFRVVFGCVMMMSVSVGLMLVWIWIRCMRWMILCRGII